MSTQNIQIGIDLGTTNSEVAINIGGNIEIVKNIFNDEYTHSVVGVDKSGNIIVGKKAKESLREDVENYKAEIKRLMGSAEEVVFPRLKKGLLAEEISAEIIKNLKEDILRKYPDFDTSAVVITVPAHFSILQSEATKRAGNLAGFDYVVLLQEPIAAAISYGFMKSKDENWLVYDLGGGTFDVALISSKGGTLSVLEHQGDNFLGGKDFDNIIVDQIIVPKIQEKYSVANIDRSNSDSSIKTIFAKLKYIAEQAKVYLSQYEKATIEISDIGMDDNGDEINFSFTFTRKEFEKLIKTKIDKTIELTNKVVKSSGIKKSSISKIVLVGGSTLVPYIRQRLEYDLKIDVDTTSDPLTSIARGASIFSTSQKIPDNVRKHKKKLKNNTLSIDLDYDTLTSETETAISGVIKELNDVEENYSLQIQSDSGHYSSQKIKLKNGKFYDTLSLETNKQNIYYLYLFNDKNKPVTIDPDSFSITHGLSVSNAPIAHTIGIVIAQRDSTNNFSYKNQFVPIFDRGSILPLKSEPTTYETIKKLEKGQDVKLQIWIKEGESDNPDRNEDICELLIKGSDIPKDLPAGTPVELTIEVDESRQLSVYAYIEQIDKSFNARGSIFAKDIDKQKLIEETETARKKVSDLSNVSSASERKSFQEKLSSISNSVKNASTDQDDGRKAQKELRELQNELARIEKDSEISVLVKKFKSSCEDVQKFIVVLLKDDKKNEKQEQFNVLKKEGETAIEKNDKELLLRINEQITDLGMSIMIENPAFWASQYERLTDGSYNFTNDDEAKYYINKGKAAIENGDEDGLQESVRGLMSLLPKEEQEILGDNLSGITK